MVNGCITLRSYRNTANEPESEGRLARNKGDTSFTRGYC